MFSPGEPIMTRKMIMEEGEADLANAIQEAVEEILGCNYAIEAAQGIVTRIIEEITDE